MNNARHYVIPYTMRIFNALPGSAVAKGLGFAMVLLLLFFGGRVATDGGVNSTAGDLRLALIHISLTAYAVFAYVYLQNTTNEVLRDLAPTIGQTPQWQRIVAQVGTYHRGGLIVAAILGLLIYAYATEITTVDSDPWQWADTQYDSRWMRIIGPLFAVWTSSVLYVMLVESARLSKLSESIESLDLLDLRPYEPLTRLGLTNALLVVGMASVLSLFLMEPGFAFFIASMLLMFTVYAWVGLMLPLRGIRKKISSAKDVELDWCRQALQAARTQLQADGSGEHSIVEITAYKAQIDGIRNWPFDNPTLIRFALYLLIPFVSMFGGAFLERAIELFLF